MGWGRKNRNFFLIAEFDKLTPIRRGADNYIEANFWQMVKGTKEAIIRVWSQLSDSGSLITKIQIAKTHPGVIISVEEFAREWEITITNNTNP